MMTGAESLDTRFLAAAKDFPYVVEITIIDLITQKNPPKGWYDRMAVRPFGDSDQL
jgi:hypothetical protein